MDTFIQRALSFLVTPPGNLIFHLVLAFSVLASLQAVLIGQRASAYRYSGRMVLGLCMLMLGQLLLFLSSGLAWQGVLNPHFFLPPLERAVTVFSLVWIVWLWNFPKPARLGDLVTGFLILGVILLFLFTYTSWTVQGGQTAFNNSWVDWIWELAALFIVLTGMAILLFSQPPGWGFGLGMLSLSLAGFVAHLALMPASGDFSGLLRLGQLAAYPLLPTLLNRLSLASDPAPAAEVVEKEKRYPQVERRRYSSEQRTVHAWLELKEQSDPEGVTNAMVKALSRTMLADLCFMIMRADDGQVIFSTGYDLVREGEIPGTMIDQSKLPMLAGSLQRGRVMRAVSGETEPIDFKVLSSTFGFTDIHSLMLLPLTINDKPWAGLLLMSPYSKRAWTADDQGYLTSELDGITRILRNAQTQTREQLSVGQLEESLIAFQTEIDKLRQENEKLNGELAEARQQVEDVDTAKSFDELVTLQQETQEQIVQLQHENRRLQMALKSQGANGASALEFDLRATLQEMARLQNELAEANARILLTEREAPQNDEQAQEEHEVIASIAQELRQPMSSIVGYTDLLLAELVGILGTLQRRFLERIRASTERMRSMLDDLIQVTTVGNGSLRLKVKPVELGSIIDGAMSDTRAQLREKDITLRVDLPEEMPAIQADQDAMQQIVVHLLQNAGAVTPLEGTVILRARTQHDDGKDYLLMQVTDTGGGIPTDQLQRVFSRRFRAENPLIPGLGDTGVGLSIAKALVEAQGGRIWVESTPGQTTTFSVLLPIIHSSEETTEG